MSERLADPERELALSYANGVVQQYLRTLWRIDERFGAIVAGTTEPTIGEMRLLWWREALENLGKDVPNEPLLIELANAVEVCGLDCAEIGAMAEGWHALLSNEILPDDLERFAEERGGQLFSLSAGILGGDSVEGLSSLGSAWALADLSFRLSDEPTAAKTRDLAARRYESVPNVRWPRHLRALGAISVLSRRDMLAGRAGRRQGSPTRVARMAWHRLTGR